MSDVKLDDDLAELSCAEEFLEYFGIEFDPAVVQVNRLHILQRFHNYIDAGQDAQQVDEDDRRMFYRGMLVRAYEDFVHSDALTEKVFKVFHMHEPQTTFVPLTEITLNKAGDAAASAPVTSGCGCGSSSGGSCSSSSVAMG